MKTIILICIFANSCLSAEKKINAEVTKQTQLINNYTKNIGLDYKKIVQQAINKENKFNKTSFSMMIWIMNHLDGEIAEMHFDVFINVIKTIGEEQALENLKLESADIQLSIVHLLEEHQEFPRLVDALRLVKAKGLE